MQVVGFGYKCQECGRGIVSERVIPEYHTRIRAYPFVVNNARIGMCDQCGAEHFSALETRRWEQAFEAEHWQLYMQPNEIRDLRKMLGLSMEQFAFLVGCTRQSLYNWERPDRGTPQSRMADVMMKLVRESRNKGSLDVLQFLRQETERFGVHVELREHNDTGATETRHG